MARHVSYQPGAVTSEDRERLLGQKGCVVFLTGLSGSGKSTIANLVEERLLAEGHLAYVLDGDKLRQGLTADLGFSAEDRAENLRRAGEVGKILAEAGLIVLAAFIAPYRESRRRLRDSIGAGRTLEVFVDAPLEVCEERDPKGLYAKARGGEIPDFTGVSAPFEPPEHPELILSTSEETPQRSAQRLHELLLERGFLEGAETSAAGRGSLARDPR
jgi:adenylylsulfate kinase